MYGYVYQMARAVARGVSEVPGTEVTILQVPEEKLIASGAHAARETLAHIHVKKRRRRLREIDIDLSAVHCCILRE